VLVDDELIHAFYDQQVPRDVCSGPQLERWYREASRKLTADAPKLLHLTREELMRHEAAGITTEAFPRTLRVGGIDCTATYLHEPGDHKDGVTVTVPLFALNQVNEDRCEWLVPGMLQAKVLALLKTLHQRPRSRLVPLPEFAAGFCQTTPFGDGSLIEVLLKAVRERTQLAVQRNDFKSEQLGPHQFMNFRVVDEHGRQLGMGRDLAGLKAELGTQARSAFQALAVLKTTSATPTASVPAPVASGGRGVTATIAKTPGPAAETAPAAPQKYIAWTFGELPELMEVRRGAQVLVGFPALLDRGTHVEIEVYDEPEVAATRHRAGLRRLVALQLREPLRFLEKNIPDLQAMAAAYMPLGTMEELRGQIIDVALDRAFLADPLPADANAFKTRLDEGRARLNLIAQEVARQAGTVLGEHAAALRKLKDSKPGREVAEDIQAQLQRLVDKRFLLHTPWFALQHLPRYLRAVVMRLDKLRADPERDATRLAELRPLEQRWVRRAAELKGAPHARMDEYRWLLEELRVSLFAQELRTPQPVSAKRLDKAWAQMQG
jgi:ATP-dependent helicase HrpA